MTETAEKLPIEAPLPKIVWAHQGDPRITAWCGDCECRVVEMRDGTCGWCDRALTTEARANEMRLELNRRAGYARYPKNPPPLKDRPPSLTHRVLEALSEPRTTLELSEMFGTTPQTIRNSISHLHKRDAITSVDKIRIDVRHYIHVYVRKDFVEGAGKRPGAASTSCDLQGQSGA